MSAQVIISTVLPILGLVNGFVMLISPTTAAKKIYKFNDKESIKPQVVDLVQANGASSFSLGVAEMLLSFTNISFSKALAMSTVPRVCFLFYSMTNKTKFGTELSSPSNLMKIIIATMLIEGKWLGDERRSMQFRGGFYLLLGFLFTLVQTSLQISQVNLIKIQLLNDSLELEERWTLSSVHLFIALQPCHTLDH